MSQVERQKEALLSRLRSVEADLSHAFGAISDVESKMARVEGAMAYLPSRLSSVRARGYAAMGHLEKSIELLAKKWADAAPLLKQSFLNNLQPLVAQIRALSAEAGRLRSDVSRGNVSYAQLATTRLAIDVFSMRSRAVSEASKIGVPLNELLGSVEAVDRDLRIAEKTIELTSRASFPFKENESPVLAVEGKIMTGDKSDGTLYLTNQRFIFEGQREVVLERKLFIATKKKMERTVLIDQPIGILQEISKGRVGLIAWTGIYISFKPESRLEETPFDVKGWEADMVMRFFNYIVGGEADRDIATVKGLPVKAAPTIQVVRCPHCGAPYTREIYRGQTTVQCEYCGAAIATGA